MKRLSVMIALGHKGCAFLLFGSRATAMASFQDDRDNAQPKPEELNPADRDEIP
jgi:hypothetical protein